MKNNEGCLTVLLPVFAIGLIFAMIYFGVQIGQWLKAGKTPTNYNQAISFINEHGNCYFPDGGTLFGAGNDRTNNRLVDNCNTANNIKLNYVFNLVNKDAILLNLIKIVNNGGARANIAQSAISLRLTQINVTNVSVDDAINFYNSYITSQQQELVEAKEKRDLQLQASLLLESATQNVENKIK